MFRWRGRSCLISQPGHKKANNRRCKRFHEKAGRSQVESSLASLNKVLFSRRVAAVAMLPSALSRSDSFRSVHVGRSRFSRCCHLFGALWFCS
jgi:hypothetical protein